MGRHNSREVINLTVTQSAKLLISNAGQIYFCGTIWPAPAGLTNAITLAVIAIKTGAVLAAIGAGYTILAKVTLGTPGAIFAAKAGVALASAVTVFAIAAGAVVAIGAGVTIWTIMIIGTGSASCAGPIS
jgi:hypothetical protein